MWLGLRETRADASRAIAMPPSAHSTRLAVLLAATSLAAVNAASASAAPVQAHQAATKAKKLTAKERRKIRRDLTAALKRNPTSVFTRNFERKAGLVDFKLPLTVRLDKSNGQGGFLPSDDQLQIDWDDSTAPWPLAGGTLPASETTFLSGTFSLEASFSDDATGYGELGALETTNGAAITMKADPFTVSEFNPTCPSGPQLAGDPAQKVVVSSAGARYGLMNLFSGEFRGSLSMRMTFASQVQDGCGGALSTTASIDNSSAPPMPLRFDGKFSVSPALTSDGKMRLGRVVIDDATTPQTSSFAYVRACTGVLTCDPMQFPARLKVKALTADVLLGDIRS
jgi:hypothetical protein